VRAYPTQSGHGARATFITEALDQKRPIEAVRASVGHRHIATTKMYDKRKLQTGKAPASPCGI
jgi:site-specific recombinase XerC